MWEGPWRPNRRGTEAAPTLHMATHDGEVAVHTIE
jgi:hypothetical protein